MSEQEKLIKLGALWEKKMQNGQQMFTGNFDINVVVFPNKHKTTDKHPDMIAYLSVKPKPKPEDDIPF